MGEDPPQGEPSLPSLPSFSERRRVNDAVMVPDRGFRKQLKALDDELEVVWNWGQEFWEIWRVPKQFGKKPFHVLSVVTKDKSYRELGADVLVKLWEGQKLLDMSLSRLTSYFDELDAQVQRRKRQRFMDELRGIGEYTYELVKDLPIVQIPKKYKIGRVSHA